MPTAACWCTFGLDELKLQPGGGRGLTLMDVDDQDAPHVSGHSFADVLLVQGQRPRRQGEGRDAAHGGSAGRRTSASARARGARIDGFVKPQRVLPA